MEKKKFTWDDLAKAIAKLPKKVRDNKVVAFFDDESESRSFDGLARSEDDIYCDPNNDEDCGTLKDLKEISDGVFDRKKYKLRTPKGTPFLWNKF